MVGNKIDITDGAEFKIVGTPLDIDRVQQACKRAMREVEQGRLSFDQPIAVVVAERDRT